MEFIQKTRDGFFSVIAGLDQGDKLGFVICAFFHFRLLLKKCGADNYSVEFC